MLHPSSFDPNSAQCARLFRRAAHHLLRPRLFPLRHRRALSVLGSRYCWSAGAHVGIWVASMRSTPTAGTDELGVKLRDLVQPHPHRRELPEQLHPLRVRSLRATPTSWYYDFIAIRDIYVTVVDTEPPALSLGGSLFASQVAHGTPGLRIDAADHGGGVRGGHGRRQRRPGRDPAHLLPWMPPDRSLRHRFRPCSDLQRTVELDTDETPWRDRLEHPPGLRLRRGDRAGGGQHGL